LPVDKIFCSTSAVGFKNIKIYRVKQGETLMEIAFKLYGDISKWKELKKLNPEKTSRAKRLSSDMLLKYIAPANEFIWIPEGNPYLIKSGDTLQSISNEVYLTTKRWREIWNNNRPLIKNPNKIYVGFTLYYKGEKIASHVAPELVKEVTKEIETENAKSENLNREDETIEAVTHSINLYSGIGVSLASNKEIDRQTVTSTFSGAQPLIELKTIYSNESLGSFSVDFFAKKIIQNIYHFPLNYENHIQFIPKWNFLKSLKFGTSHSILFHSYVGKYSNTNIEYKLKSSFVGFAFLIPREKSWFEVHVEKAYSGEVISNESHFRNLDGIRIDTAWVYPLTKTLKLLPSLNYYSLNQESVQYQLKIFEARLMLAREFEFK
jgi:hypothetical protein